mmetsp:Transcript_26497/g.63085  ORF Transcript_26497/g.63085 Transcript_26497/m.63085 type:complete len:562 (+) Transcript_26497:120-1805(+)
MGFFNNKTSWLTPPGQRTQHHQQQQQQQGGHHGQQYQQGYSQQYQQPTTTAAATAGSTNYSSNYANNPPAYNPSASSTMATATSSTTTRTHGGAAVAPNQQQQQQPKKYINVNGVMKKNPEFTKWQQQQQSSSSSSPQPQNQQHQTQIQQQQQQHLRQQQQELGFVSNMDDHARLMQDLQQDVPLAESTNATIEMMQEPDISLEAGMQPNEMVDALGQVLGKYEVPFGLINKLMMLSEYQSLEFIVDDSGSMNMISDTFNSTTGQPNTRWQEAWQRLKEMVEILAYVPFNQIGIEFLNRPTRIQLKRQQLPNASGGGTTTTAESPTSFLQRANAEIDAAFQSLPRGTTPVFRKLQESMLRGQGYSIARYLMCDGVPDGLNAVQEITRLVRNRPNPQQNPLTFLSCTNQDEEVEWMKDAEEIAPFCSEADDYDDERREVVGDQGLALPYTRGFWLVCQLVAAMNPDDLDAMDESIPFTKSTLDNLLGHVSSQESYKYYWDHFTKAQATRQVARIDGRPSPIDQLKKRQRWNYQDFLMAPLARDIPQVRQFQQQMIQLSSQQA